MENSDPEEEEEDAAAEKLLDDEYNKVADKKEDTDFRINEDRVDDADDDDVDAALVVVLAATVFTANIVLFPVRLVTSIPVYFPILFPKEAETSPDDK